MPLSAPAAPPELACGNCGRRMQVLRLDGHYGSRVEIDTCSACHLIWFDGFESVRLAPTGMLALLDALAEAQREPHQLLGKHARCPRCAGRLKTIHNRSRWGPTLQLECVRGHGAYQTFAQFLSEKGLVRALGSGDRAALLAAGNLWCVNCGAPLGARDARCTYCDSLPGMVDVARLARALDPEGATEAHAVHATRASHTAFECLACGAPLPKDRAASCSSCGATLAVAQLAQAHAAVSALGALLHEHARNPAPHVVARRLEALEADLPRRRDWAREMQADADRRLGHDPEPERDGWEGRRHIGWVIDAAQALWSLLWRSWR
ncbi:zf-TFIIB domain-containing protein [Piscinibacter koreensis]|uniref:Zf-TFIIB domain-containing protein n=1 Tax=Piscinibacter koreensis TaxID=2742824 RepID=A0A7Y6NKI3_9BURK|nr:zf-TFIIB domain-containing protein [Schlegelella koreensis]NUZ04885.1 zf-TFIIB domain-containing protein [Schlegelella koreensis]